MAMEREEVNNHQSFVQRVIIVQHQVLQPLHVHLEHTHLLKVTRGWMIVWHVMQVPTVLVRVKQRYLACVMLVITVLPVLQQPHPIPVQLAPTTRMPVYHASINVCPVRMEPGVGWAVRHRLHAWLDTSIHLHHRRVYPHANNVRLDTRAQIRAWMNLKNVVPDIIVQAALPSSHVPCVRLAIIVPVPPPHRHRCKRMNVQLELHVLLDWIMCLTLHNLNVQLASIVQPAVGRLGRIVMPARISPIVVARCKVTVCNALLDNIVLVEAHGPVAIVQRAIIVRVVHPLPHSMHVQLVVIVPLLEVKA